jgi:hypothetical protein
MLSFLRQVSPGGRFLLNSFLPDRANSETECEVTLTGSTIGVEKVWTKE